jgi:hypothetical protein
MYYIKCVFLCLAFSASILSAAEFTISSYNCGGLTEHYDYLRAVSMQKLMQERYTAEPLQMSQNEKIQQLALKILFTTDPHAKLLAQQEWDQKNYQTLSAHLTAAPTDPNSPNKAWNAKADQMLSSYLIRPVAIYDEEMQRTLFQYLQTMSPDKNANLQEQLLEARSAMAKTIFERDMRFDIICLQEASYLDASMFPEKYQVLFTDSSHSVNGIAWNKQRFELIESLGNILNKGFAVHLLDKETSKTILVASGHISGCNPYRVEIDRRTGTADSAKGDHELKTIIELFNEREADLMLIGMDSNVTSLHPRLNILKEAGYRLDCEQFIEPTCTNPYQALNTRIDWIALKTDSIEAALTNIPVLSVGLNSIETNISDHKPIAAKVAY